MRRHGLEPSKREPVSDIDTGALGTVWKALDARPPISGADIAEQSLNKKAPVDTIRSIGRYSMRRQMIVRALVAASLCRQR